MAARRIAPFLCKKVLKKSKVPTAHIWDLHKKVNVRISAYSWRTVMQLQLVEHEGDAAVLCDGASSIPMTPNMLEQFAS